MRPIGFVPDEFYMRPLPDFLVKFLESSQKPVVYMSFGTVFQLPFDQLATIYKDLSNQDSYAFVWSVSKGLSAGNDLFEDLKKSNPGSNENVLLVSGIPQMTLLMRDEVKVYINHCGKSYVLLKTYLWFVFYVEITMSQISFVH